MNLPMQPIITDQNGYPRFRENPLVRHLLDFATPKGCGLNELACLPGISREDWTQLAQLIGYSLNGYSELSYVSDADYQAAMRMAENPEKTQEGARIEVLESILEDIRTGLRAASVAAFRIHPDDLQP